MAIVRQRIRIVAPRHSLGLGLALGLSLALPQRAYAEADKQASCTVRVIHAIDGPPPSAEGHTVTRPALKIDPKIDKLRPYLVKAPFTAWREFNLLEKKYIQLAAKTPQPFVLPNGRAASLTFLEHLPDEPGHPHRVRVQLQIGEPTRPALNTVFVVDEGGIVLQAGQRYDRGMLILGTSCELLH